MTPRKVDFRFWQTLALSKKLLKTELYTEAGDHTMTTVDAFVVGIATASATNSAGTLGNVVEKRARPHNVGATSSITILWYIYAPKRSITTVCNTFIKKYTILFSFFIIMDIWNIRNSTISW